MHQALTLTALVHTLRYEAQGIISVELHPYENTIFPPFEAGSHIDLHLPNGLIRSYSLLNSPTETHRYLVGVLCDRNSRGGSKWIHEQLRVGMTLQISPPRNNFELDLQAEHSVLVAGGIGVTPIYCMFQELLRRGKSVELIYCARSRQEAAMLAALTGTDAKVRFHFNDEENGLPDMHQYLLGQSPSTHFYCCGPTSMLDAFEAVCQSLGYEHAHIERFAAVPLDQNAQDDSFELRLARSGQTIQVPADKSVLDVLLEAGVSVEHSCKEGVCGACETSILEGEADHRDGVLSKKEREAGRSMMVCVSRCKRGPIVLDI